MRRREAYDERRASRAVAATTAGRAARPGVLWGLVFGATIASSASTYLSAFPTAASRTRLALSMRGNAGFAALFGPIRGIDTVAGYTAYKTLMFSVILAAVGLGAGIVALWVPTAVLAAGVGATSKVGMGLGASLFVATSIVAAAAMFMAIGMLVGQLAATRHDANLVGAGILAASYLVRMVADSDSALAWLRWASPLGWIEELRPLTGSRPFAFVPIVALVVVLVVVAVRMAKQRDLGASAFASRDTPKPRTFLLGGEAGLTVRLTRPAIVAWIGALATSGLVFGLVAQAAANALRGSPGLERTIARLGGSRAGAASYLGFTFVFAA